MMTGAGHEFLDSLMDFGIKLGLDKIRYLLKKLDNPHLQYPSVLIAGTNGKGSAAKFLSTILKENGYKVGLYTSPHLVSVEERIQINDRNIPYETLDEICLTLKNIVQKLPVQFIPTYFEALTAAAFFYFHRKKIDILVCEVGMGGRYDATNVLAPFIEIIMPVSFDHTEFLGNSIQEIAAEKAGIIKDKTFIVSGKQDKSAAKVIRNTAGIRHAKPFFYPYDFFYRTVSSSFPDGQVFNFYGIEEMKNVKIKMHGRQQIHNCSVALQAAMLIDRHLFPLKEKLIRTGTEKTFWPARMQLLSDDPFILLDGAHNSAGVRTLVKGLAEYFPGEKFIFLVGILKEKDDRQILKLLAPLAEMFIFTAPDTPRAILPGLLLKTMAQLNCSIPVRVSEKPADAFLLLRDLKTETKRIICGSLYLAGDVLKKTGQIYS